MKPTLERFLALAIFAGLLISASPVGSNSDHADVRLHAAHQSQLVGPNEAAIKAGATEQPAGPSNASPMTVVNPAADGSVRVLKKLSAAGPQNVRRRTVVAGIPDWIWCMLHFCKRGL